MTEFTPIARTQDIAPGEMAAFEVNGWEIVVANVDGNYVAFDGRCTCMSLFSGHLEAGNTRDKRPNAWALLSDGRLSDGTVACPTHATVYRVENGSPIKGPGEIPLNTYEVRSEAGQLLVATNSDSERRFWNDAKAA